jgi:hypothetical protein
MIKFTNINIIITIKHGKPMTFKLNTPNPEIGHGGFETFKLDIPNYEI